MRKIFVLLTTIFLLTGCATKQKSNYDPMLEQFDDLAVIYYDYEGHIAERKIAYNLIWKEKGKEMPWLRLKHIGVGFFDLNNNGEQEMFAYVKSTWTRNEICPFEGCPLAIFQKEGGKYEALPWYTAYEGETKTFGTSFSPYIIDLKTKGYHAIAMGERSENPNTLIFAWDGKRYNIILDERDLEL